jgi:hypothetical protein
MPLSDANNGFLSQWFSSAARRLLLAGRFRCIGAALELTTGRFRAISGTLRSLSLADFSRAFRTAAPLALRAAGVLFIFADRDGMEIPRTLNRAP